MGLSTFDEQIPLNATKTLVNGMGTTYQTLVNPPSNNLRIDAILAANSDAIDHVLNIALFAGGDDFQIVSVNVPAGAGSGGVNPVDVLGSGPLPIQGGFVLWPGNSVDVQVEVAVVGGADVRITALGGSV